MNTLPPFKDKTQSKVITHPRVLFVGDSREMRGGVSTVIKSIESSYLWDKYHCDWLECQINDRIPVKVWYLLKGLVKGLWAIPKHQIIHFHTATGNSLKVQLPFFLYARFLRKKIIVHLHVGNQLKTAGHNRLFSYFCHKSNLVITLGESFRSLVPGFIEGHTSVTHLYNPAPEIEQREDTYPYFLFAAYFDSERNKGYDVLLKAFSDVIRCHPEWKLVLCGDGDIKQVRHIIANYGLEKSIELPGWVSGEKKEFYFKHAYAYCLCSRNEGLPITILESMALGLPIITTPVGCIPEILTDNESALFFETDDVRQLSCQMQKLIEDKELSRALSIRSQAIARDKLSLDRFCKRLDGIYQSLYSDNTRSIL